MANLQIISDISLAAVYCGTYAKYNDGNLFGQWMKFSDYSDASEFMAACADLHKDEKDPEFMFQDYEHFPERFYSESMSEEEIQNIYSFIAVAEQLENYDDDDWVNLHNQYCSENSLSDDEIYMFDDEFFNTYFDGRPMEAARAACFGSLNWSDKYIRFNGYANLESFDDPMNYIDEDAIIQDIIDNPQNYSL